MAGFDAESYLRLTDGLPWSPVLPAAGAETAAHGITRRLTAAVQDRSG